MVFLPAEVIIIIGQGGPTVPDPRARAGALVVPAQSGFCCHAFIWLSDICCLAVQPLGLKGYVRTPGHLSFCLVRQAVAHTHIRFCLVWQAVAHTHIRFCLVWQAVGHTYIRFCLVWQAVAHPHIRFCLVSLAAGNLVACWERPPAPARCLVIRWTACVSAPCMSRAHDSEPPRMNGPGYHDIISRRRAL